MLFLETKGYNYSKQRCERITSWFVGQYLPRYKLLINIDHLGLLRQEVFGWMWAADCDHRPREFEIEERNTLPCSRFITLHECNLLMSLLNLSCATDERGLTQINSALVEVFIILQ